VGLVSLDPPYADRRSARFPEQFTQITTTRARFER
jgi:hypothetical protein